MGFSNIHRVLTVLRTLTTLCPPTVSPPPPRPSIPPSQHPSMPPLLKDSSARRLGLLVQGLVNGEDHQVEDCDTMMKRDLKAFLQNVKKLPFDFKHYMYHRHVNRDEAMQVPNKKDYRKLEKGFYRTLFKLAKAHEDYLADGGEYMKDTTLLELTFLRLEKCLSQQQEE